MSIGTAYRMGGARRFAVLFRHTMPKREQPAQPDLHEKRRERVEYCAPGELVRDAIGQPRSIAQRLELVTMDPASEGPANLFVHEQPLRLVLGMAGQPVDNTGDPEFHFGAALNASRSADHAHRRKGRAEEGHRVVAFVETEHYRDRRVDVDLPDEGGHTP